MFAHELRDMLTGQMEDCEYLKNNSLAGNIYYEDEKGKKYPVNFVHVDGAGNLIFRFYNWRTDMEYADWLKHRQAWKDKVRQTVLSRDIHALKALFVEIKGVEFLESVAAYCHLLRYLRDMQVQTHLMDRYVFHNEGFLKDAPKEVHESLKEIEAFMQKESKENPEIRDRIEGEKWDLEQDEGFAKFLEETGQKVEKKDD